jgi:hypothetical protein
MKMEFKDLIKHDGEIVTFLGENFKFVIDWNGSNDVATFSTLKVMRFWDNKEGEEIIFNNLLEKCSIWATLNFEIRGVPLQVDNGLTLNDIGQDIYYGEVKSWSEYLQIVEFMLKRVLKQITEKCRHEDYNLVRLNNYVACYVVCSECKEILFNFCK